MSTTQTTNVIDELYMDNGGCELPCLLGITPGQTSIQEVNSQFSSIGIFEDQTRTVDYYQNIAFVSKSHPKDFVSSTSDSRWGFSMRVKDDVVVGLLTGAKDINAFSTPSLSGFLTYFGQPEEIWIRVIESQLIDENPDHEIVLYYPSQGVFIRWRGGANTVLSQTAKGITMTACPQDLPMSDTQGFSPPFFYLFAPNEKIPFNDIIKFHLAEEPSGSYQSISMTDLQKFYTMYLDETTQDCFPLFYSW